MHRTVVKAAVGTLGALLVIPLSATGALAKGDNDINKQFIENAVSVNTLAGTVTLPLLEGRHGSQVVWYVVTESSNKDDAHRRGVNWSAKLTNALGTKAVQHATVKGGLLDFDGTVDFSLTRRVVAGATGFPPAVAQAGAKGDALYSPLVTTNGRTVLNATEIANPSGIHDAVVGNIDYANKRVTLDTLNGFWEGKRVQYLHQEASVELVAALEGSTWAPNLDAAPGLGSFDQKTSARAAIIPIVNGQQGLNNPQRQGLQSAVLEGADPLNITQVVPGQNDYTPIWDVTPAVWTDAAIAAGQRVRLTDHDDVADLFAESALTSGGGGPANASLNGLRALPGISNCPVVVQLD